MLAAVRTSVLPKRKTGNSGKPELCEAPFSFRAREIGEGGGSRRPQARTSGENSVVNLNARGAFHQWGGQDSPRPLRGRGFLKTSLLGERRSMNHYSEYSN